MILQVAKRIANIRFDFYFFYRIRQRSGLRISVLNLRLKKFLRIAPEYGTIFPVKTNVFPGKNVKIEDCHERRENKVLCY